MSFIYFCSDTVTSCHVVFGELIMSFMRTLHCVRCGDEVGRERGEMGYKYCLLCGEDVAKEERASWCVVQEYGKGCYQFVTSESALRTLKQTNQKNTRGE
jgi:hypothetical protein